MKNIWEKINSLLARKIEFTEDSRPFIDAFLFAAKDLEKLDEMRKTDGWVVLEKKIREEAHARIMERIKDDLTLKCLMNLLHISDSKPQWVQLEEEVDKLLNEQ